MYVHMNNVIKHWTLFEGVMFESGSTIQMIVIEYDDHKAVILSLLCSNYML